MGTEDIKDYEHHMHNFKLLLRFLKLEGKYSIFKYLLFTKQNRSPNDLFNAINAAEVTCILSYHSQCDDIDRKWSAVFSYVPISNLRWSQERLLGREMESMCRKWGEFLNRNNFLKSKIE